MAQHYTGGPDWVQCGEKSGFARLSIENYRASRDMNVSALCFVVKADGGMVVAEFLIMQPAEIY